MTTRTRRAPANRPPRGRRQRWLVAALVCGAALLAGRRPAATTARLPSTNPVSQTSSTIAISADGALLLAVNPDSNSLTLVDTASRSVIVELPVGADPRAVAVAPDGATAFVANHGDDTLAVVDLAAQAVGATLPVGDRPVGVALSPDARYLAVAELGDDRVRLLDVARLVTLALEPVADRPHGLAFTPDGRRLLVTHLLSGRVTLLPVRAQRVFLPLVGLGGWDGRASAIGPPAGRPSDAAGWPPQVATWPNVAPAPAVVVNPAGTRAYLAQTMANGLGYNTSFNTTVFPKVSVLNLENDSHQLQEHIPLPETDQPVGLPWDLALTPDGRKLWVVNSASNDLSVIDLTVPTFPVGVANIPVGDNPRGIALSPDGTTAYVNNILAGTVSVIDTAGYTVTGVITVTAIPLPPALLNGKQLFFSSARPDLAQARWISCNTCHVEGEHDGRTWLIQYLGAVPPGQQPIIRRNTTGLLGMIETYPLRWSAEWDESADSEFSVRFEQFGSGLIDGPLHPTLGEPNQGRSYDLDCLALFIDSLAAPAGRAPLGPAELRGRAIFESPQTGCAVCHPAPLYTDLQVHDVGTADGPGEWFGPLIDTPTLRWLADSLPYLHDGSAATLLEALTIANPADEHGVTSHLTPAELADLIAFLKALPYQAP